MHQRPLAMILATSLLFAACANDPDPEPSAIGNDVEDSEVETEPVEEPDDDEPDEAEDEVDVTVVPDEITEEYVEAVLQELEVLRAETIVEFRESNGEITIEVMDKLSSTYSENWLDAARTDLNNIAEAEFAGVNDSDDFQAAVPTVNGILDSAEGCVFAMTTVDLSGLLEDPPDEHPRLYQLVLQERELVEDYNPTPWVIERVPADTDHWREERPCSE